MALDPRILQALTGSGGLLGDVAQFPGLVDQPLSPEEQLLQIVAAQPQAPIQQAPQQGGGFLEGIINNPAASRALLQTGLGLLGANAPSTDPRAGDIGFALSQGLGAGLQSLEKSAAIQKQEKQQQFQRDIAIRQLDIQEAGLTGKAAEKKLETANKKRAGQLFGNLANPKKRRAIPASEREATIKAQKDELATLDPLLAEKVINLELKREKEADGIRKELDSKPEVKGFIDTRVKFNQAQTVLNDYLERGGSAKGISAIAVDQVIVNNLSKILDPGSVVRESEFARTAEGAALVNKVVGAIEKVRAGGVGLRDSDRIEVVAAMKKLRDESEKPFKARVGQFEKIIERRGFIREEIIPPSITEAIPFVPPGQAQPPAVGVTSPTRLRFDAQGNPVR